MDKVEKVIKLSPARLLITQGVPAYAPRIPKLVASRAEIRRQKRRTGGAGDVSARRLGAPLGACARFDFIIPRPDLPGDEIPPDN